MSNDNDSPSPGSRSHLVTIPLVWLAFAASLFYTGTDSIWLAPALASALVAGIVFLMPGIRSGWNVPWSPFVFLICLNWLYLAVTLFRSTSPYVSELFLAALSFQPWLFLTLILRNDNGRSVRLHANAMLMAIAVVAAGAIIQFLFLYGRYGPRIHYPFLDPNNLAALLNIGLLPAIGMFLTSSGRQRTLLCGGLAAMLYCALLATQSRGGLLCAYAGLGVLLPFVVLSLKKKGRKLPAMLGCAVIIPLCMQLYTHFVNGGPGIAFNLLSHNPVSLTDRLALWHSTWAMIGHHPLGGTGLGTFYFYYSAYRLPSDRSDGFFAHMDALQLWSETGIAAFVLFYACYAAIAVRTFHATKMAHADQHDVCARMIASFAALTAIFLHSHVNFLIYLPALGIPLGAVLAAWYADTEAIIADRRVVVAPGGYAKLAAFATVTIVAAVIGQWAVGGALDVHYIERAAQAEAHGNAQAMRDAVGLADRFAPRASSRAAQYEARWRALALIQDKNLSGADRKKYFDDGMAQINRAMKLNPAFSYLGTVRARLYILGQKFELIDDGYTRATEDLQHVLKSDPLCLEARYMLAEIYKRQGELSNAKNILGEGLNWPRPKGQPEVDLLANVALLCKETGDDACYSRLIAQAAEIAQRYKLNASK